MRQLKIQRMEGRPRHLGGPCKRKTDCSLPTCCSISERTSSGRRWSPGVFRHPLHLAAVVLEAFGTFKGVFVRVHYQVPLVIVLVGDLDGIEGNRDVLFAHPEETADAEDEGSGSALAIDEHIHDLADLTVVRVIDALLVPMGD